MPVLVALALGFRFDAVASFLGSLQAHTMCGPTSPVGGVTRALLVPEFH